MSQTDVRPWPGDNDHEGAQTNHPSVNADEAPAGPLDEIKSGLKVWANLGVTLGESLDKQTASFNRFMRRLQHNTPVDYGSAASGVFPASGVLVLILGSPDQGYRWDVTNVVVGGIDANTAVAGTAGLYVSGFAPVTPNLNPAGLSDVADIAKSLPNVGFYGTRQLVVNDQEYLLVVIFGGTPGTTYVADFSATVFPVDAAGGKDEITL